MVWQFNVKRTVGVLTCLGAESRQHYTHNDTKTGKLLEGLDAQGYGNGATDRWMTLQCTCGKVFEMWDSDVIPGEEEDWQKVDCGCGAAATWVPAPRVETRGRLALRWDKRRVTQNFSLSQETMEKIGRIAEQEQIRYSHALDRLVEAGFPLLYRKES